MISVIIPVFNSQDFISKSIDSALMQPQVTEVVVIDDGSTDESVSIILNMQKGDNRIKFYQHHDKKNHGRSVSRNLGILNAESEFIAFLDSDDFYLPGRFDLDIEILNKKESVDGVYNAIGAFFYRKYTEKEEGKLRITTVRDSINPENLFDNMGPIGHYGYFSGIGLTVRKNIFDKIGNFNENLKVAEDTELWLKMSLKANLVGGILNTPVSMRGVHDSNVSFKSESLYNCNLLKMYNSLYLWGKLNKISLERLTKIWQKIWLYRRINNSRLNKDLLIWFKELLVKPDLIFYADNYKTFPVFWRLKNKF